MGAPAAAVFVGSLVRTTSDKRSDKNSNSKSMNLESFSNNLPALENDESCVTPKPEAFQQTFLTNTTLTDATIVELSSNTAYLIENIFTEDDMNMIDMMSAILGAESENDVNNNMLYDCNPGSGAAATSNVQQQQELYRKFLKNIISK